MPPIGTSWGAVLDGWLATVGVAAILTPIVALVLDSVYTTRGYASTVPILVAVGISYLVGGYVAGRMAGYRTSWHGMMVGFIGLFIVLALLVVDIALALDVFGTSGRLIQVLPLVLGVAQYQSAETFAFGGVLGILVAIFAAWLGGVLAPSRILPVATRSVDDRVAAAPVVEQRRASATEIRQPRRRFRLLPSPGRKGGERVDDVDAVKRVDEVERTDRIESP